MSTLPLYAFDIETTSLTWDTGRVTTVALCSAGHSFVLEDDDEARLLRALRSHLASLPAGIVATWNGSVFDGPFLAGRADTLGVARPCALFDDRSITPKYEPQPGYPGWGMHPIFDAAGTGLHRHVDVAYLWRQRAEATGIAWSLKPVARHLGIGVVEVDRARMGDLSRPERMAYNLSDVFATLELAEGVELVHPGAVMPPLPAAAAA